MVRVLRGILAVILGLVTLFVLVGAGEFVGHTIFPPPPGLDPNDLDSIKANIDKIPAGVFVSVLVAWLLAAFAGGWVAARLAPGGKLAFGLAIGTLGLLAAVANMWMIPHPIWVWIIGVAEFLPAAYLGAMLAMPRRSKAPAIT
jgi:hypothetical protein